MEFCMFSCVCIGSLWVFWFSPSQNMPVGGLTDRMWMLVCVHGTSVPFKIYPLMPIAPGDMRHDHAQDKVITVDWWMNEFRARHVTSNYFSRVLQNTIFYTVYFPLEIAGIVHQYTSVHQSNCYDFFLNYYNNCNYVTIVSGKVTVLV